MAKRGKGPKPLVVVYVAVPPKAKPGDDLKVTVYRKRKNTPEPPDYDVTATVEVQHTLDGMAESIRDLCPEREGESVTISAKGHEPVTLTSATRRKIDAELKRVAENQVEVDNGETDPAEE
jgi:hypothetical protein